MPIGKPSSFDEVAHKLLQAKTIGIISHANPDSDAIASTCALAKALKSLGKKVWCANESVVRPYYHFIDGAKEILNSIPESATDFIVLVDCAELHRVGKTFEQTLSQGEELINIDHHYVNSYFGQENIVIPTASSTCEVLNDLIVILGVPLSSDLAETLLTGIISDTGSFRYLSTTPHTLEIAANLVRAGARINEISRSLFSSDTIEEVRFRSACLGEVKLYHEGRTAVVIVPEEYFAKFNVGIDASDPLVEMARDIAGVRVSFLARKSGDLWRASLRSGSQNDDVAAIAMKFGGGGHKSAAGLKSRLPLEEFQAQVLAEIEKLYSA